MFQKRKHWLPILVVAAILVPLACGDMREDEFQCEQAVTRLVTCCPEFRSQKVHCMYSTGCGETTYPGLSVADSECIQTQSCQAMVDTGVCDRAQRSGEVVIHDPGTSSSDTTHGRVCP